MVFRSPYSRVLLNPRATYLVPRARKMLCILLLLYNISSIQSDFSVLKAYHIMTRIVDGGFIDEKKS